VHNNPRVLPCHAINDGGDEPSHQRFWASNPHLADTWISQELNVSNSLLQFIEDDMPARKQRMRIDRGLDTLGASVEKPNPKCILQARDGFRNGGLGHSETPCALGHAAALDDGRENVQVAQLEPSTDASIPSRFVLGHRLYL